VANAIESMYRVMHALHELEDAWNARRHESPSHAALSHPVNLNVGRIEGGDWASSVPAWCVIDVRVAIYPGQSIEAAKAEIEGVVRAASRGGPFLQNNPPEVVDNGFEAEGYVPENADAPIAALAGAHKRVFGSDLETVASTATTDARFFGLYGKMPALVYGPRTEFTHGFDERVNLRSLCDITKALFLFIAEWCGVAGSSEICAS
jgi:acetylornithine deacetylase